MKIAFVNPPRISRQRAIEAEDCCWGAGPLVLPAMLLQCATEAITSGHEVQFIDLAIDKPTTLTDWQPDLVVHALAWQWWEPVNRAMGELCGDVPRIALAVPPGYAVRYLLDKEHVPFAVAYSEPEAVIASLPLEAGDLMEWRDLAPSIAQKGTYNIIKRSGIVSNCIDRMGLIYYDSLVPAHYWAHYTAAVYQVSRGCPYCCTFCVWGGSVVTDRTYKIKSPARVALELDWLQRGARKHTGRWIPLYLLAAQLTTGSWAERFAREMGDETYPFQSNVNFADLTADNLAALQRAGLVSCAAGLDGAGNGVLKIMNKPYDMDKAIEGLLIMQEAGLLKRTRVRYGMGETAEDVAEACEWLDRIKNAGVKRLRVNFAPIIHYEGTEAHLLNRGYVLDELPGKGPTRLIQKDPADWAPYVEKLREMKWLGRVGARK